MGVGTAGATGYGYYTGDVKTSGAIIAGLLVRHGMGRIDQKVAIRVAEMLVSQDPDIMKRGLQMVAKNDRLLGALRMADIPLAVGATNIANQQPQPLKVYLNAGERDRQMGT